MWALLAKLGLWLVRLYAGPAAAREAGRLEQRAATDREALIRTEEVRRDQAEIAARPDLGRDALLRRMRDGSL